VGDTAPEDQPNLGAQEFFELRHEHVLLHCIEEATRDCMQSIERHGFDRIQANWEDAKKQIMGNMAMQRPGPAAVWSALRSVPGTQSGAGAAVITSPPQDAAIIDALLRGPVDLQLLRHVARLSCESCPPYHGELLECWEIVGHALEPTPHAVTRGSLAYLQARFAEEVKSTVYRAQSARLGGVPDAWSVVRELGRIKFEVHSFPSAAAHVWYAAYVAARAGFVHLLAELPDRAAPCSDLCPMLRTVCMLMARRLQATAMSGEPPDFTTAGDVDRADLLRADLAQEGNSFHDVLVSLLLGRSFAFGKLPEGTIEDWLWFRLHGVHIASDDSDRAPAFGQLLDALRHHVLELPPTHYDPTASTGAVIGPSGGAGLVPPGASSGLRGFGDPFTSSMGMGQGAVAGVTQTLNFVKVLLLTAQYGHAVQQLKAQDRCLHGPALHMALVLSRTGTLEALARPEPPLDMRALVCDYACHFHCSEQLRYFRVLDLPDRVEALQRLLLRGGVGTSDELLGYIDANGRHRPGLLERTLHEHGSGDQAEFVDLCAQAGRVASERGQYREAIRLFHLGRCHSEVLQVLCRCLQLPVWHEPATAVAEEAMLLSQDIQRFFAIYERNLDRYALSSHTWMVARKLYAARTFHSFCDRGQPEAALDVFDRERLLPLATDQDQEPGAEGDGEMLAEYPRIVGDYVQILRHAASQGNVAVVALQARVRQLQSFLAVHSHRLVLSQETIATLASLALC